MSRTFALTLATAVVAVALSAGRADAQLVTVYSPVVAAPAPVSVVAYRPVIAPTVVYRPATPVYTVARPVVTTVAPVAYTRTRYRPFLGRSVTRVRYGYAPVSYYAW